MKCFFGKGKNSLISLEKVSTFVNAVTVCKSCNNLSQVEEDNYKSVRWACFLKTVCQNEKCFKSKINGFVNMSNKSGQFFEINYFCFFVSTAEQKSDLGIIIIIKIIIYIYFFDVELGWRTLVRSWKMNQNLPENQFEHMISQQFELRN